MKEFLKKEAPLFAPAAGMFLMALLVLQVFMCFGMFSKNKGLVVTIIQMFLFTAAITVVILFAMPGKALLKHLRDENYYRVRSAAGDNVVTLLSKLTALYTLVLAVVGGLYLLMLGLDVLWSTVAFPEEKEGVTEIWKTLFPGPNNAGAVAATVLELLMIAFMFTALVFFCVTMSYNLFTKSKYAGFLAAIFFAMLAYSIMKINLSVLANLDTLTYHLASAGFCAVCGVALTVITCGSIKKRNWKSE